MTLQLYAQTVLCLSETNAGAFDFFLNRTTNKKLQEDRRGNKNGWGGGGV